MVQLTHAQQSIFPVLADTPKWCMLSTAYNGGDPLYFYSPFDYFYQKDTLVDGKTYSKLIGGFTQQPVALVRNEIKKTFIRRVMPNQMPIAFFTETLLYDFGMNTTNDSIIVTTTANPYNQNQSATIVVKFFASDSVLLNGIRRKRLQLKYYNPRGYLPPLRDMTWTEGFGILKNPFYDGLLLSDAGVSTMGLDIKGQRVYQDSTIANGCSPKRVGVYDPLQTNISVYPNPVVHQLNIDMSRAGILPFTEVIIYNLVGKAVFKERVQTLDTLLSIDLSFLNAGMYILSLQTQNQKLFSKKIIKSN